jgi:hypothetical protein
MMVAAACCRHDGKAKGKRQKVKMKTTRQPLSLLPFAFYLLP